MLFLRSVICLCLLCLVTVECNFLKRCMEKEHDLNVVLLEDDFAEWSLKYVQKAVESAIEKDEALNEAQGIAVIISVIISVIITSKGNNSSFSLCVLS